MKRLKQWTIAHPILYVAAYAALYFTWFLLLENFRDPVIIIHSSLDDKIPFCEYFIIPYVMWFAWFGLTFVYFYRHSREDFFNLCRYMFTGLTICLMIYTILPTGLNLRPELTNNNIFSQMVGLIYSMDTSTNVCPSIHVFASIVLNAIALRHEGFKHNKLAHGASTVLAILICLSTVFLKQHSVIDVLGGCVLGLALYPLCNRSFDENTQGEYEVHIS